MKIPSLNKDQLRRLREWANTISGYYGAPVYLCGSALTKKKPRDFDVRICLSDGDFIVRYGANVDIENWWARKAMGKWDDSHWAWADDCVRRTKNGWAETPCNIDFQIQPKCHWDKHDKDSRMRLDTREVATHGKTQNKT